MLALSATVVQAQSPRTETIGSVRVSALGHDEIFEDVTWEKDGEHDGSMDIGITSKFIELAGTTPPKLILDIKPARPGSKVTVRQRSVSFMEVDGDGPHVVVAGSEQRSAWTPLKALAPGRFIVRKTVKQKIRLRPELFVKAFAGDSGWLVLAKACKSPDDGACYTITDPEFEVTVTAASGLVTRKIVRVFTPDGC